MSLDRLFDPVSMLVALAALNVIALGVWLKADRIRLVVRPPARAAARQAAPTVEVEPTPVAVHSEAEAEPASSASVAAGGEERLVQDLKRWLARMEPPGAPRRSAGLHGSPRAEVAP